MPLADVLAGRPAISTPALAGRVMIPRPGRSPLDRPCAHMRLSDDPATRAEPPPRRGGADEERGGDRFAAPSVRPTRTSAPAPARGPARSRRRVGPRHRVRNHRPEGRGHGDEAGDNSARGSLAEGRGHGDEPRPGEPRCTGATSDHPPPRPARLLRPFRSATPLHPSLYEEKGRSGGVRGAAEGEGAQQTPSSGTRARPAALAGAVRAGVDDGLEAVEASGARSYPEMRRRGGKRWPARIFRVRGGSHASGEWRYCATSGWEGRGMGGERYAPATFWVAGPSACWFARACGEAGDAGGANGAGGVDGASRMDGMGRGAGEVSLAALEFAPGARGGRTRLPALTARRGPRRARAPSR